MSFSDFNIANMSINPSELSSSGGQKVFHAKVVDFQGGKAVLEVNGRTVFAESEVPLKMNAEFDIVIRGQQSGGKLNVQIIGAREGDSGAIRPLTDTMISSRLIGFELPEHKSAVPIARSLLNHEVPVTRSNMDSMIQVLPPNASRQAIDFAASLLKEGLPLSKEIINLIPQMAREIEELPANLRSAAEASAGNARSDGSAQLPAAGDAGIVSGQQASADASRLQNFVPVTAESAAEALEKLPGFVNAFLNSVEAGLVKAAETGATANPAAADRADLTGKIIDLLKIIPDTPPRDSAALDKNIERLAANLRDSDIRNPELAKIRDQLADNMARILAETQGDKKYSELRATLQQALREVADFKAPAASTTLEDPALFARSMQFFADNISDTMSRLDQLPALLSATAENAPMAKNEVLDLLTLISRLQTLQFDKTDSLLMKEFLDSAGKWADNTAKLLDAQQPLTKNTAEHFTARLAADNDNTALLNRVRVMADNPALRQEMETLVRSLDNFSDIRSAIAQLSDSPGMPQDFAANLARGFQFANLSNLVQHTGANQTNALVTYFPIQVGDRTEMGKLKIFRREQDRQRDNRFKPLDPFDARMVLILDTEFLGLSSVTFQTFKSRAIRCDIEVQDKRRQVVVEKFLDELRADLKNTAYEQNQVHVKVRRKKTVKPPGVHEEQQAASIVSIDLRI